MLATLFCGDRSVSDGQIASRHEKFAECGLGDAFASIEKLLPQSATVDVPNGTLAGINDTWIILPDGRSLPVTLVGQDVVFGIPRASLGFPDEDPLNACAIVDQSGKVMTAPIKMAR